jgi:hypothetical protein
MITILVIVIGVPLIVLVLNDILDGRFKGISFKEKKDEDK